MKATDNKFLIVKQGVVLTPIIEPVIISLDPFFEKAGLKAYVTSGLRDGEDQLRVVRKYLVVKGLNKVYPAAMTCKITDMIRGEYVWQRAWSNLLNIGVIINPPLRAKCLMDYTSNGVNKKGQFINQTPHATGNCFDIGGAGGADATIKDELEVMQIAIKTGVPGLINILPEHNNNAIHCDCRKLK